MVKNCGPDLKQARQTGLSARKAPRTKSRGPKGLQLEVGARRAPILLVLNVFHDGLTSCGLIFYLIGPLFTLDFWVNIASLVSCWDKVQFNRCIMCKISCMIWYDLPWFWYTWLIVIFWKLKMPAVWKRELEKKFLSRTQNGNGEIQMCLFFVGWDTSQCLSVINCQMVHIAFFLLGCFCAFGNGKTFKSRASQIHTVGWSDPNS